MIKSACLWPRVKPANAGPHENRHDLGHLLKSKDLVTSVRGPAGSGKTTMMKETVKAITALSGRNVIVAAPSSSAVGIFKKDDFSKSDTVQRFTLDEVAPGDRIRVSKNFQSAGRRFRNNELLTVTGIEDGKITVEAGEIISRGALHIDQGVCVTSHASQGKTVDQVIVSVPVRSFTHANDAQFYVSMSEKSRHNPS
jgi:ABC-type cobalamin/Fe3+-siderophores transport system ATPase subunit